MPNHNPYSQTYNLGWRNHPNFSWKSDAQTSQPSFQAHHNFQNSHGYASPYAHCMHSLKSKRQLTLNLLKTCQILKILLQSSHLLLVFKRKVSFHLNHSKIPRENTMQMQVVLEANTRIKSNQSSLFAVVKLLKNPLLNLVRKMMSQSLRVRKGLNLNIAKKRLIPRQYFHFLMP